MSSVSPEKRRPLWRCVVEPFVSPGVPDLWIIRKSVVIIVLGIAVWALYVAIGRVCVPAIHSRPGSAFTRGAGIGILVPYLILWLMFLWSYLTVVPVSEDPAEKLYDNGNRSSFAAPWNGDATTSQHWGHDLPMSFSGTSEPHTRMATSTVDESAHVSPAFAPNVANLTPSSPNAYAANWRTSDSLPTMTELPAPSQNRVRMPTTARVQRPVPGVSTQPRWCQYCRIVKPDRTHHCRHCATCVLQFDHHCVWIGRCVGWRNHAVFVTFCLWAGMLCLFNFIVLIVDTSLAAKVDGQKVALIAICGFLFIFTLLMMLPTHVFLIMSGRSTVESFQTGDQNRAEEAALKLAFDNPICPTKEVRAVKKSWELEYGGVAVNDRWRFSDRRRDLWKQQMGKQWLGWIFPIGRPEGDGVHFPPNPRFGPNGEWLPMRDWPKVVAI